MLTYKLGNLFDYAEQNRCIIAHICNNRGVMGSGFVIPLAQKYPLAKSDYLSLKSYQLGETQFVLEKGVIVANMIAQNGFISPENPQPCSLASLSWCLLTVMDLASHMDLPIYMPRIGAGLGGATWEHVEQIINNCLDAYFDVTVPNVTIFTLPQEVDKFPEVSYE